MRKKKINKILKSKKVGLIIYARMTSKRFPGKVLTKIYDNQTISEIIVNKLKNNGCKKQIVVATTKRKSDKKIINFCKKNKIKYFLGSHENVFQRTVQCIKKYKFQYFVRICADRPLFDTDLMEKMIKIITSKNFDIVTNAFPRTFPKGLTCEVAKSSIFEKTNQNKLLKKDKEHIFNYFYRNKIYKIHNIKSKFDTKFIKKNFCIDTKKDIKKIRNILSYFDKLKKNVSTNNIYKLI